MLVGKTTTVLCALAISVSLAACGTDATAPREQHVETHMSESDERAVIQNGIDFNVTSYQEMKDFKEIFHEESTIGKSVRVRGKMGSSILEKTIVVTSDDKENPKSESVMFKIEGLPEEAYPAEGENLTITGVVSVDTNGATYVHVLRDGYTSSRALTE